jgi:phosphonate transport system substrate-binding protein
MAISALLLVCILLPYQAGAGDGRPTYTFAAFPRRPAVNMHTMWRPLLDRLEQELGITFKLKLYENMDAFEEDVKRGTPDFIFSAPYHSVLARREQGYIPLLRGSGLISGILVVKKGSAIHGVIDVHHQDVAFVGARNVCTFLVRYYLSQEHTKLNFKQLYSGSSENVFKHVLVGKVVAGSVLDIELRNADPATRAQLRIIYETPKVKPHPISAHPRVPRDVQERFSDTVVRLWHDTEGQALLKAVRFIDPVRADYAIDYQPLEDMDLELLKRGD